jgi:cell division protein FtsW (lipid II flippase)
VEVVRLVRVRRGVKAGPSTPSKETRMSTLTTQTPTASTTRSYGSVVSNVLLAAFGLSVVHTVYAWQSGLEDPDFTVTRPLTWAFYAVAFLVAFVARREGRRLAWAVAAYLVLLLGIALLYYPVTFTPEKQTVFGWIENDVYVGLLVTALVLQVLRLRHVTLTTGR